MTMTPEQTKEFLSGLGLSADGATLAAAAVVEPDAKAKKAKKDKKGKAKQATPTPTPEVTIQPTTTRPEDPNAIVYDPAWLDGYVLDASDMKAASDMLFQRHKYPRKDPRNALLHRLNTEFIQRVKRDRNPSKTDGFVRAKIKADEFTPEEVALAIKMLRKAKKQ